MDKIVVLIIAIFAHNDALRGYRDDANAHHEHGEHHNGAKKPQHN